MTDPLAPYRLHYWTGIQGRGELIRLALEEAALPYVDVARLPEAEGGGDAALVARMRGHDFPLVAPFAPPFLEVPDRSFVLAQVALILDYLGRRHGLVPVDEAHALAAHQLQLTITDFIAEVHDTHHPVGVGLYYEDQKPEAARRAKEFREARMPKFLGWFERALARNTAARGEWILGRELSYVDLSLFQVLTGLGYAFTNALSQMSDTIPHLLALRARVAARPRIAAYLASERRIPWSEDGIFRHYPELDPAPAGGAGG